MKQKPTTINVIEQNLGESDSSYYQRLSAWIAGDDIRTTTDLREFKTCDFHLAPERP